HRKWFWWRGIDLQFSIGYSTPPNLVTEIDTYVLYAILHHVLGNHEFLNWWINDGFFILLRYILWIISNLDRYSVYVKWQGPSEEALSFIIPNILIQEDLRSNFWWPWRITKNDSFVTTIASRSGWRLWGLWSWFRCRRSHSERTSLSVLKH